MISASFFHFDSDHNNILSFSFFFFLTLLACEHQLPAKQEQNPGKCNSSISRTCDWHFLLCFQDSSSSSDSSSSDSEDQKKKRKKDKKKKKKKVDTNEPATADVPLSKHSHNYLLLS